MPFVALNCAAIPESLIESELFGYRSGAFTGARREGMKGKILQSSGGTLFLDEIGDMPVELQTRLLRVLEEQEVIPLGTETAVKVDLRVICASHQNLRAMIARGEFREDLYYRLNGITLELPPLALRTDKERLIREFLAAETSDSRPAAIEVDAFEQLLAYRWPGQRPRVAQCDPHCPGDMRRRRRAAPGLAQRGSRRRRWLQQCARTGVRANLSPPSERSCCAPSVSAAATCRGPPSSSASAATLCIVAASGSILRRRAPAPSPSRWHGICFSLQVQRR